MISFRCWFCGRAYLKAEEQARSRLDCTCGRRLKIPRRSGASSKAFSLSEWLVEALIYGGAGALVGFALSIAVLSRLWVFRRPSEVILVATAFGFVVGALFGERGINWIGQKLRDRENA